MADQTPQTAAIAAQTALNKTKFLAAYAGTGNVSAAAKIADIGRRTHYDWHREDPEYAARFADAVEEAADRLETEARRRAVTGVPEGVYYKGVQVATIQKYSDGLLMFLLKGARPEKYAEKNEGKGKGGHPAGMRLEDVVVGGRPS